MGVLTAACGSADRIAAPIFVPTSPIEELLGAPIDPVKAAAWETALHEASVVRCMASEGFEYTPDKDLNLHTPDAAASTEPELVELDTAAQALGHALEERDLADNDRDSSGESAEFLVALFLTCAGPFESPTSSAEGSRRPDFLDELAAAYESDPAVLTGAQEWRECMRSLGHDYESPGAAQYDFAVRAFEPTPEHLDPGVNSAVDLVESLDAEIRRLGTLARLEAAVADAHADCAVNWLDARKDVRTKLADDFIDRYG